MLDEDQREVLKSNLYARYVSHSGEKDQSAAHKIGNLSMKSLFPGYVRPTVQEFNALWNECFFAFDTSTLLNAYRYSPDTSEQFLRLLERLEERVWIPHQTALEFFKNRLTVIGDQVRSYDDIQKQLTAVVDEFRALRKHPFLSEPRLKQFEELVKTIGEELSQSKNKHRELITQDPHQVRLVKLFEGKTGQPYPPEKLKEIHEEGKKRYQEKTPPGFKDTEKPEPDRYGDLVMWYQIIDKANSDKKPVVFVSDDTKEDWWWIFQNQTLGPRPELVAEMLTKANVAFHMYQPSQFMETVGGILDEQVDAKAIEEAKQVEQEKAEADKRRMQGYVRTLMESSKDPEARKAWIEFTSPKAAQPDQETKEGERFIIWETVDQRHERFSAVAEFRAIVQKLQLQWPRHAKIHDLPGALELLLVASNRMMELVAKGNLPETDHITYVCTEMLEPILTGDTKSEDMRRVFWHQGEVAIKMLGTISESILSFLHE
jgi:hypothetical protein